MFDAEVGLGVDGGDRLLFEAEVGPGVDGGDRLLSDAEVDPGVDGGDGQLLSKYRRRTHAVLAAMLSLSFVLLSYSFSSMLFLTIFIK